jgi:hypothetical protein
MKSAVSRVETVLANHGDVGGRNVDAIVPNRDKIVKNIAIFFVSFTTAGLMDRRFCRLLCGMRP